MNAEPKLIETWLDVAPQYINFALKFPRSPKKALKPYSGKGAVASDLTTLMLAGVGVSYLLFLILAPLGFVLAPPGFQEGASEVQSGGDIVVQWLTKNPKVVPPLMLIAVIALAVFVHVLARIPIVLGGTGRFRAYLGGSVEDSVNAALGFSAVYVPYFMLLVLSTMLLAAWSPSHYGVWKLASGLLGGIPPFVYYPLSLAATHPNTKGWEAFWAFVVSVGLASVLLGLLLS